MKNQMTIRKGLKRKFVKLMNKRIRREDGKYFILGEAIAKVLFLIFLGLFVLGLIYLSVKYIGTAGLLTWYLFKGNF